MKSYDHKSIEKKWQAKWDKAKIYRTEDKSKKKKFYVLDMFPYPSGEGLHVGHPKGYIATDVISRMKRMQGYNVLHPMGFDAFGLPAENYAIKNKVHPEVAVKKNVARYKSQLKKIGLDYDWSREVNTTDPKYYKWTQWIFLELWKKGLAYESNEPINWCPSCKTGLANEDLEGNRCERCGTEVEKKPLRQWVLEITKYADRLIDDLDIKDKDGSPLLKWPEYIKEMQRNWIGRSEGALIKFSLTNFKTSIEVFTTRADTIFGATYLVIAPEHNLLNELKDKIKNWTEVEKYVKETKSKSELDRTTNDKTKTGVELKGVKAINPANKEEIPVWIADYVLDGYGTGAIMAVPAHDDRDYNFAIKFNLPIKYVIAPYIYDQNSPPRADKKNVPRLAVKAFVKNPKDNTYLCIEWNKNHGVDWRTIVSGGVEEGEDMILAAKREVEEETGYKNLKFIKHLGSPELVDFYHKPKDENRLAEFHGLLFELENEEQALIDNTETSKHTYKWVKEKDVLNFINHGNNFFLRILNNDTGPLVEQGATKLINSGRFNGLDSDLAKKEIIKFVGGKEKTTYKLRDWVFSRQRYWGEPIPLIHCDSCGVVAVPEKDLPVKLPKVKSYEPTGTGESPLAGIEKWVNVKCPKCKGKAKRETNTMPQWAGSSWYYLRYMDPKNAKALVDKKKEKYWNIVDVYVGGAEHATRHLIYARFWHKFLYDIGLVANTEPFARLQNVGLIGGADGRKMSKRFGNVINPDDVIARLGADTLRVYEMFMGPFDQGISWSEDSIVGPRRFLERVYKIGSNLDGKTKTPNHIESLLHKTIKKVGEDIDAMRFNTAISTLMVLLNEIEKSEISKDDFKKMLQLLAPFAPHVSEELWYMLGEKKSINSSPWPKYSDSKLVEDEIKIVVQVNGKVRSEIVIKAGEAQEVVEFKALHDSQVLKYTNANTPKKVIYIKDRLINIVI